MTDHQTRSLTRSVRFLGTIAGVFFAAIGYGVRRTFLIMLDMYNDMGFPEASRQMSLTWLGSPLVLGCVLLLSVAIVIATWLAPIHWAGRLMVGAVVLTWLSFAGAVWFFISIVSFMATSWFTPQ